MKTIEFQDMNQNELTIQHSSNIFEAYWIYLKGEQFKEEEDNLGNKIPVALQLSRNQAEMLINGLRDLFNDNDNQF